MIFIYVVFDNANKNFLFGPEYKLDNANYQEYMI